MGVRRPVIVVAAPMWPPSTPSKTGGDGAAGISGRPLPIQKVLITALMRGEHAIPAATVLIIAFAEADVIIKRRRRRRRCFDSLVIAAGSLLPPVFGFVTIVLVVAVHARLSSRRGPNFLPW